ncbi:MAG: Hsp20/alpha crystallin family protein [Proteobacteria bacterium]|nr:Hsp20/alpha crystallin family protein [Pseudomonadota bacterium]
MTMTPVPVKQTAPAPAPAATPDAWRSFHSEIDRLFDRFLGGFGLMPFPFARSEGAAAMAVPAVDIAEDAGAYKVTAELPGMTEKDVEVSLSDRMLTVRGEKRQERTETKQDYHLTERSYGEFRRSFMLPEGVDAAKIDASFANGVLTVTIPKAAKAEPQKIAVKSAV